MISDYSHSAGRGGDRTSEPLPGVGSQTSAIDAHLQWRDPLPERERAEVDRAEPGKDFAGEGVPTAKPSGE